MYNADDFFFHTDMLPVTDKQQHIKTQINQEYRVALDYMKPRWTTIQELYRMLGNKQKTKGKISSRLMYKYYHTVLAAMYSDSLKTEFDPVDPGDVGACENIRILYKRDCSLMEKPQLDYEWLATTIIEGSALLLFTGWDTEKQIPMPVVIDGLSLLRDPFATSVNGNKSGEGKLMYFGRYIFLTEYELNRRFKMGIYKGNVEDINPYDGSMDDDMERRARVLSQGYTDVNAFISPKIGQNRMYKLLQWFTHVDGKAYVYTVDANATIEPIQTIELKGGFPIVKREISPIPGQWDGFSICELVEDFHKQMNIVINAALDTQKAGAYPRYMVNKNMIENQADLMKAHFNQYIMVDGQPQGIIEEIPRKQVSQDTTYIIGQLDYLAQSATATSDMQQGVQSKAYRSATESSIIQQSTDTRYGLSAKVLTWSEKQFVEWWYWYVKNHFSEVSQKMVRLQGEGRYIWRPLTKDQISMLKDPDISVVSFAEQAQERQRKLQALTVLQQELMMNPLADQQYVIKRKMELQGLSEDEINRVFPPTADFYIAEMENMGLSENKPQKIHVQDDDYQHIREHLKANDTPATRAHVKAHKMALLQKKASKEAQDMSKGSGSFTAQEQTVQPNTPNLPRLDTPSNNTKL